MQFTFYRLAKFCWVPFADVCVRSLQGSGEECRIYGGLVKTPLLHPSHFYQFVNQSLPNFGTVQGSVVVSNALPDCMFRSKILAVKVADMLRRSSKNVENRSFFGPRFLGEGMPQILDIHFQIALACEHVDSFGWVLFSELEGIADEKRSNRW